jgi:hypothetical protein
MWSELIELKLSWPAMRRTALKESESPIWSLAPGRFSWLAADLGVERTYSPHIGFVYSPRTVRAPHLAPDQLIENRAETQNPASSRSLVNLHASPRHHFFEIANG